MKIFISTVVATMLASTLVYGQSVMRIQPGATITLAGNAVITLQDVSLDVAGGIEHTGDGWIRFSGTQNNTIGGSIDPVFNVLQIEKTGNATISLLRPIHIKSNIYFSSGFIDLNNNNILLGPDAILNGEKESSRVIGPTGGYIQITRNILAFDVTNAGNLGVVITSSQPMGNTVIRRGHHSQTSSSGNGNSVLRTYDIIPLNNSALNATMRFHYFDGELNGLAENNLVMWKSLGNNQWTNQGYTSRDMTLNYVEKTGIADFSQWTLSNVGNALPLTWGSFHIQCVNNVVNLSWQTIQESNTVSFIIEGSADASNWTTITTRAAAGQSNSPVNYSQSIQFSPVKFYRIKQTDIDGHFTYSPVLVSNCGENEIFSVYPNPIENDRIHLSMSGSQGDGIIWLRLYDSKGALIKQQKEILRTGMNQFIINTPQLASGFYTLITTWESGKTKMIRLIRK